MLVDLVIHNVYAVHFCLFKTLTTRDTQSAAGCSWLLSQLYICDVLQAVREAVSIPVLANGNIRTLQDVHDCIAYTGVEGVMSAESLLEDPALFWPQRLQLGGELPFLNALQAVSNACHASSSCYLSAECIEQTALHFLCQKNLFNRSIISASLFFAYAYAKYQRSKHLAIIPALLRSS